mgnify:FL=1
MLTKFLDLENKSVLVTGGGSGIGAEITKAFIQQGAKVSFVQRSDAEHFCDKVEAEFNSRPYFIKCDITDLSALKKAVDLANSVNGDADILVNNAANDDRHETLNVTEEYWDNSQAINLKSYFFACQYVLPGMQAKGGGSIINFSSISYMMGNSGYPAYTTANAGIMGMTRSLAREFGPNNIRVNAIAPGWVLTKKQLDKWATLEGLKTHLDRQCIKSHLKEEDIAGGVLFLASASSSMITGQLIAIDGGVVMTG